MHVVTVLLWFGASMALAVVGDLLLHVAHCPGFIGFHLQASVEHRLWLHARRGSYAPARHVAHLRSDGKGVAPAKANEASGLTGGAPCLLRPREGMGEAPPGSLRGREGLQWIGARRSRSLVAPDEIHPHGAVLRRGLQEVRSAPARWQYEGDVQSVQPEDVQMGRSWERRGPL